MKAIGNIGGIDLACDNTVEVRLFKRVAGGTHNPVPVGDHEDYADHADHAPGGSEPFAGTCRWNLSLEPVAGTCCWNLLLEPVAGACHQRGVPPQWLIHIQGADLQQSVQCCSELGGEVICPVGDIGSYGMMCVIKEPAGAVTALIQTKESTA